MKNIIPNISVKNCKEALEYYKKLFNAEVKNLQLADNVEMFKEHKGKIIHSELHINENCILYFIDFFDEKPVESNINLILNLESEEEINNLYSSLKESGTTSFELQKTF
ncbi:VOC family protein [Hathewaya histolytica]|uniref:VOC family protein n=1 Tax=Hathewaya histolytica TaxID=1498 RepID=UPI003B679009